MTIEERSPKDSDNLAFTLAERFEDAGFQITSFGRLG